MNFFEKHSLLTLVFLALFPRLTLLFGSFVSGGLLWWLGWIFTPHLLVAFLAIPYFSTNPFLVVVAWIFAIGGSSAECRSVRKKKK